MKSVHRSHPAWGELASFDLGQLADDAWTTVSEHLAGCDTCCSLIDTIPQDSFVRELRSVRPVDETEAARGGAENSQVDATTDVPAGLVGHPRYRVLEALGAGGMGAVFKAEHTVMGRLVAVKVLRQDLRDRKTAIDRLAGEVKALARLSHANLVAAFDAEYCGEDLYVVMEYVEGESLDRIIRRCGSIPFGLACNWIGQVALGLQYAFEQGLVHRDLKPANLVVTPQGQVKILDFGLARLIDKHHSASAQTPDGSIVGTPAYTAPEQARAPKAADIRADLYSLGCTWYEMLTGQPPFPGGNTLQQLLAHQDQSPPPVTRVRSDVPREVEALFDRLLAKNPAERFQTPEGFLEALKRLEQTPSQSSTSRTVHQKRRPLVMVAVVIASLLLLGAGLWQLIQHLDPAAGPSAAVNSADEPGKFVGTWKDRVAGYDELWTVKNNDGTWSINGKLQLKGVETGSFIGTNIKESDGTLTFTRKFVKHPRNANLLDDITIVVKAEGENLRYTWSGGGKNGSSALEKVPAEREKPAADTLGKFRGVWIADMATGFRVVMEISIKNDKIDVAADCLNKKGELAGSFVGVDTAIKDGVLTFSQKFVKKPVSTWSNGKFHTLEMVSNNVLKFRWKGGGTEVFTRVSR